jgi:single-strand DNA-binding protein
MYSNTIIIGRLGRDPELRWTDSGKAVCDVSIASDYKYNKDGTQVQETTWWRISFWGNTAENVNKYMRKGRLVYVEGRIRPDENGGPRIWENSEGESRASFELMGNVIRFLDRASESEETSSDNDLPF